MADAYIDICNTCGELVGNHASTCTDLAAVLTDVEAFYRRYVVFESEHPPIALALWTAHAHALDAFDVTQYLHLHSPTRRCGKTTCMECAQLLVPRPLLTSNISDAALFRIIDEERSTILLDEADAIFGPRSDREDLRSLLNAGYRRGAKVVRCEAAGRKQEVRLFDAFGAKAIASIGRLPDTIEDRSVRIGMHRRSAGEHIERFRYRIALVRADGLRSRLAAWAETAVDDLRDARPDLPDELNDRAQDGWEPFLAIADAAGGDWPARARAAAVALAGDSATAAGEPLSHQLLADIRTVLTAHAVDVIFTRQLADDLVHLDAALGPWAEEWGPKLKEDHGLRSVGRRIGLLLAEFGIAAKKVRIDSETYQGFRTDVFDSAFARYLPPLSSGISEQSPTRNNAGSRDLLRSESPSVPSSEGSMTAEEALANVRHAFPTATSI